MHAQACELFAQAFVAAEITHLRARNARTLALIRRPLLFARPLARDAARPVLAATSRDAAQLSERIG
jgi:hypothetical protein